MSSPPSWSPGSWRSKPARHQPTWPEPPKLDAVLGRLKQMPPLVSVGEVEKLKAQLALAAQGRSFVLQGGDCAERFVDCTSEAVIRKLKILLQMSLVLTYGSRKPVVRIGRIAGQYAKPRSQETETINGQALPVFRGDNINAFEPDPAARVPDPDRLERGYLLSAATLNYVRALVQGGFASLRAPEHWDLDFLPGHGSHAAFRDIAERIRDAIDYLESLGGTSESVQGIDFFTSHEALVLAFEEALTRPARASERWYNQGAHLLWIGHRTRQVDHAHVEYCRGIGNPIGIKVGPGTTPDELLRLLDVVDPSHEPGRIMLISRYGVSVIARELPAIVRAVRQTGRPVLWSCDPMHGNTEVSDGGLKTRSFEAIERELASAFEIHAAEGGHLGGVHFELTGDDVTECTGGVEGLSAADLSRSYTTGCDPRLNYAQSMEMAFLIGRMLKRDDPPAAPW